MQEHAEPCPTCGFTPSIEILDGAQLMSDDLDFWARTNAEEYAYKVHLQHEARDLLARVPLDELRRRYDVADVLQQFGTWAVTTFGVECLTDSYPIDKTRLSEPDWLEHMSEKTWVLLDDFNAALSAGRQRYHDLARRRPHRADHAS
jgi:hypothetical protein